MMRAQIVHVTDHALLRWRERAAIRGDANVYEIVNAVKQSRVVKKHEPMPFCMPRLQDSVYSFGNGILFILKSVSIDEYHLVTVITNHSNSYRYNFSPEKLNQKKHKCQKQIKKHTGRKSLNAIHESQELWGENFDVKTKSNGNTKKVYYDRSRVIMYIIREFVFLRDRISAALIFFKIQNDLIWQRQQLLINKKIHPAA